MRTLKNVLVTGGCGFIGANFIRYLFERSDFTGRIINADALTYAGNPDNLVEIRERFGTPQGDRYVFSRCDIRDVSTITELFEGYDIDTVVHFAAESHVDRSIVGPRAFIETNVIGTFNLLEAARAHWISGERTRAGVLFHHVSTDEVFGSLENGGVFTEQTAYSPRSPYSASKASSDHIVRAYGHTFALPFTISNCSNNYGAYQFPEKLIPLMVLNAFDGRHLPVYGDGGNIRDWLYVEDHVSAIWRILNAGKPGETYLIGGENEWRNIDLVETICDAVAAVNGHSPSHYRSLIRFVTDRPGHDRRYAVCCDKIKRELGWRQEHPFASGLGKTVAWYHEHRIWVERVRSGAYQQWIEANYVNR